jgi:hypothetical protein
MIPRATIIVQLPPQIRYAPFYSTHFRQHATPSSQPLFQTLRCVNSHKKRLNFKLERCWQLNLQKTPIEYRKRIATAAHTPLREAGCTRVFFLSSDIDDPRRKLVMHVLHKRRPTSVDRRCLLVDVLDARSSIVLHVRIVSRLVYTIHS